MRQLVINIYTDLYNAEDCKSESTTEFFPISFTTQRRELDSIITLDEHTEAVEQLSIGHYPGIDGLPASRQ